MIEGRSERASPGLLSIATLTGFPTVKLGVSPRIRKIRSPQDKKAIGTPREMNQDDKKPVLMNFKSTVKADGDKITFFPDEGGKSWDVINPETLKDHVGHHVELSAQVYKDKGQIHVMKVTML